VIDDLNPTLRGWFGDFQLSRARIFGTLDGWIRRRLRSLLRKQQTLRGIADVRGADQTRWPNRFFAEHGLFSLQATYGAVRQSCCRLKPPTGEPDAGEPHVRFGGRGRRVTDSPYPYHRHDGRRPAVTEDALPRLRAGPQRPADSLHRL